VRHLARLVDDLLDVSSIVRGGMELRRQPVSVSGVIADAVELARPLADAQRHQLSIAFAREPLFVEGDLTRLTQVIGNLLDNAVKYTPPGGHISVSAGREGGDALITVRDDGIGIPESMLERVFEPFARSEEARASSARGMGIGLSVVRDLVELHGGRIEARSAGRDRGSEFRVHLPLCASPRARETETESEKRPAEERTSPTAAAPAP